MADDSLSRTMASVGKVIDTITPWLLELGSWLFGALIAFSIVLLGALLAVGQHDAAILVASAALAIALPLDVAGFIVLRLAADMKKVGLEETALTAFRDVGFPVDDQAPPGTDGATAEQRRARVVLGYSYSLLSITIIVTLVGVTGALWHMGWWIGVLFVLMVIVSMVVASLAISSRPDPLGLSARQ